MIRPIPKKHFMHGIATTYCMMAYTDDMTLDDFIEMIEHMKSVCGSNVQELSSTMDASEPLPGKDWYWMWNDNDYHNELECYFTTEEQAIYYSMANTMDFPETQEEAFARIARKLTQSAMQATQQTQVHTQASDMLNRIKARKQGRITGQVAGGVTQIEQPQPNVESDFCHDSKKAAELLKNIKDRQARKDKS